MTEPPSLLRYRNGFSRASTPSRLVPVTLLTFFSLTSFLIRLDWPDTGIIRGYALLVGLLLLVIRKLSHGYRYPTLFVTKFVTGTSDSTTSKPPLRLFFQFIVTCLLVCRGAAQTVTPSPTASLTFNTLRWWLVLLQRQ